MKINNYFMKISNKFWISIIISYFIMISSFLDEIYFVNTVSITKLEISFVAILFTFLIYLILKKFFKKENIIKLYLIFILIVAISSSTNELKKIYEDIAYQEFFNEYTDRINEIYSNGSLYFRIFSSEAKKILLDMNIEPMKEKTDLVKGRRIELFDVINKGLSGQEDNHIWTDKKIVQIPLYIKSDISEGNIIINCYPYQEQLVLVYVDNQYMTEYRIDEEANLHIPFKKEEKNDVVIIKFVLPYANKSPKEDDPYSNDPRELGIDLRSIIIESNGEDLYE